MNLIDMYQIAVASNCNPAILAAREPEIESVVVSGAELETRLNKGQIELAVSQKWLVKYIQDCD